MMRFITLLLVSLWSKAVLGGWHLEVHIVFANDFSAELKCQVVSAGWEWLL